MRDYNYLLKVWDDIKIRYPIESEYHDYTLDELELLEKLDDVFGDLIELFQRNS